MPSPRLAGFTAKRSRPSRVIAPPVGSTKPAIICSVVVLPQPDGPSNETNSPFSTPSDSPSTARCVPKRLVSFSRMRKLTRAPMLRGAELHRGFPQLAQQALPVCGWPSKRRNQGTWGRSACARLGSHTPQHCAGLSSDRLGSALDLAVPALGPVLALGVDRVPVGRDQLGGALADRRHLAELGWNHDLLADRAVAVVLQEHELER